MMQIIFSAQIKKFVFEKIENPLSLSSIVLPWRTMRQAFTPCAAITLS
jgi:hypothetical protein